MPLTFTESKRDIEGFVQTQLKERIKEKLQDIQDYRTSTIFAKTLNEELHAKMIEAEEKSCQALYGDLPADFFNDEDFSKIPISNSDYVTEKKIALAKINLEFVKNLDFGKRKPLSDHDFGSAFFLSSFFFSGGGVHIGLTNFLGGFDGEFEFCVKSYPGIQQHPSSRSTPPNQNPVFFFSQTPITVRWVYL